MSQSFLNIADKYQVQGEAALQEGPKELEENQMRKEAQEWIEVILEERFPSSFGDSLRSGVRLCKVVNTIWPKSISRIRRSVAKHHQLQNINSYLFMCQKLGMTDAYLFRAEDLFEGNDLGRVVKNILQLKQVVQDQVPHHDLQMLLVHVASVRRKLQEKKVPSLKSNQLTSGGSRRQRWNMQRPPPPPPPPSKLTMQNTFGEKSTTSNSCRSPSIDSVCSASSLSTLESSTSVTTTASMFKTNFNEYNNLAILEAVAKTSMLLKHRGSVGRAESYDETMSFSSFEELSNVDSIDQIEDDQEWIQLLYPKFDEVRNSVIQEEANDAQKQKLSRAEIAQILQFGIATEEGREKLWFHFLRFDQQPLLNAPWRKGVVKSIKEGPSKTTLKLLIRRGIPVQFRGEAWLLCSGALKRIVGRKSYYLKTLQTLEEEDASFTEKGGTNATTISSFSPTRRILNAIYRRNPGCTMIEHNKVLKRIVEHALGVLEEEAAFWLVTHILEYMLPTDYFGSTISLHLDLRVLMDLLADHDPELFAHMGNLGFDVTSRFAKTIGEWMQSMFVFPICERLENREFASRIWDIFMFQGNKTLFAVALSLLQLVRKDILASSSLADAILPFLQSFTVAADSQAQFFTLFDDNVKVCSKKAISALRKKHRANLARMLHHDEDNVLADLFAKHRKGTVHDENTSQENVSYLELYMEHQRFFMRRFDNKSMGRMQSLLQASFPSQPIGDTEWCVF